MLPLSSGTVLEIAKKLGGDGIQGSILKRLLSDNPYIAEYCTNPAVLTGICDLFKLSTSVKTTLTTNMMNLVTLKHPSLASVFSSQMPAEFENLCRLAKEGIFSGQTSFSKPDLEKLNINPEHFVGKCTRQEQVFLLSFKSPTHSVSAAIAKKVFVYNFIALPCMYVTIVH